MKNNPLKTKGFSLKNAFSVIKKSFSSSGSYKSARARTYQPLYSPHGSMSILSSANKTPFNFFSPDPRAVFVDLARDGFLKNVIANRCVSIVARGAASVKLNITENGQAGQIAKLLSTPSPHSSWNQFLETAISQFLLSGNCYIFASRNGIQVNELDLLRPDRVEVVLANDGTKYYRYKIDGSSQIILPDAEGFVDILHLKTFNPMNDLYGISPLYAAQEAIDTQNDCIRWSRALLKNGAKPSGALIVNQENNFGGSLTDEQFDSLKEQLSSTSLNVEDSFKTWVFENGLKWQQIGISPQEMNVADTRDTMTRYIACSLGVPSQLLGVKGDNTYNTMAEARLALWEETIMPILNMFCGGLSSWFSGVTKKSISITPNLDSISTLAEKRATTHTAINNSTAVTNAEKRNILGLDVGNQDSNL